MQPPIQNVTIADLLDALKANPTFTTGNPSTEFLQYLERIETADPQAFDKDEDNLGSNWGHYQFTAGTLTCTRVINSWTSIGSPLYARRLLAATLTTCLVARWLCSDINPQPSFYISDSYLVNIAELLWECWKSADGVS